MNRIQQLCLALLVAGTIAACAGGGNDGGGNGGGDDLQISVELNLWPAPFSVGNEMVFDATNAWSNAPGALSFDWDFDGDGTWDVSGGTLASEEYTPEEAGSFTGKVRITDSAGVTAQAQKQYTVQPEGSGGGDVDQLKVALNCWPSPFSVGAEMTFDASNAWSNDPPLSFDWDFDGDGVWDISGGNKPSVTYTPEAEGTYTAKVRVTDGAERTAEATRQYEVKPEGSTYDPNGPPVAQLGAWPTEGNAPLEVHLDGLSCWAKDGKALTNYEYDLDGNGSFEVSKPNGKEFLHTFSTAGEYTVTIRVTAGNGKTSTGSKLIKVNPAPPGGGGGGGGGSDPGDPPTEYKFDPVAVVIASDTLINVGESVSFDASSSIDPLGEIVLFEWDMDGDGEFELSGPLMTSQSRTFTEPGTHIVTMRVTDDEGNTSEYPAYVIVLASGAP